MNPYFDMAKGHWVFTETDLEHPIRTLPERSNLPKETLILRSQRFFEHIFAEKRNETRSALAPSAIPVCKYETLETPRGFLGQDRFTLWPVRSTHIEFFNVNV